MAPFVQCMMCFCVCIYVLTHDLCMRLVRPGFESQQGSPTPGVIGYWN